MSLLKIAIIGAGPAGLALARLLQISGREALSVTVFEKDSSPTARGQQAGGTLDLREGSGLAAIKAARLWDEFQKVARYEGEAIMIATKDGSRLVDVKAGSSAAKAGGDRPEIDREALRRMLLHSVAEKSVKWDHTLDHVSLDGHLHFNQHSQRPGPFDLIVGADGAWSKVRPVLTTTTPHYAGISGFEMKIHPADTVHPELKNSIGTGSNFVYGSNQSLVAQRMDSDTITVSTWFRTPDESFTRTLSHNRSPAQTHAAIQSRYSTWAPEMRHWIRCTDPDSIRPWPLYELPIDHHWPHHNRVTCIGDAAHLFTPFAGEGVNAALRDALELSRAIVSSSTAASLDDKIVDFETEMFKRAETIAAESAGNKDAMFRDDAPVGFLLRIAEKASAEATVAGFKVAKPLGWGWVKGLLAGYFRWLIWWGRWRREAGERKASRRRAWRRAMSLGPK